MDKNKEEKENLITLIEVKSLGFSPKMIEALLPEPILKTNPRYKCAVPIKLWKEDIVYKAMETKEFIKARKVSEKRRSRAAKAVETKRAKLRAEVNEQIKKIHVVNNPVLKGTGLVKKFTSLVDQPKSIM